MKKQMNYNYAFLFYDVGEKRVQKVFKICKKYLSHFQKSVFRGEMTPSKFMQLRGELNRVIDEEEDFVCTLSERFLPRWRSGGFPHRSNPRYTVRLKCARW